MLSLEESFFDHVPKPVQQVKIKRFRIIPVIQHKAVATSEVPEPSLKRHLFSDNGSDKVGDFIHKSETIASS